MIANERDQEVNNILIKSVQGGRVELGQTISLQRVLQHPYLL